MAILPKELSILYVLPLGEEERNKLSASKPDMYKYYLRLTVLRPDTEMPQLHLKFGRYIYERESSAELGGYGGILDRTELESAVSGLLSDNNIPIAPEDILADADARQILPF